ncbi:peptide/nickel transport system permease protein [Microbacterium endophyticum]|uniref:Peptide/nickel transport system permease protein n=1 Tax=Microbacterium endophyticum TaxID=1526412 RepID=A0A7W4V4W6_9MICO|nr:ABC transporter permease [Microbacterium endophyticum]MBB2976922.1 peptide/nickel transport system permease protein [Microbacterium endophyticum]NIK35760.1 peptide/nickel transport system permease protein [Microbacterium endophyticum]
MTVLRFLLPKIAQGVFVVWAAYTVAFLLIHALPGDPVLAALAVKGGDATSTDPEVLNAVRAQYGLDGPLWQQYLNGFFGLFRGDLGISISTGAPVADIIGRALPHTAAVAVFALILGFVLALGFTVWAYIARPAWVRQVLVQIPPLGIAIPAFLSGLVLITVFSFGLGWFPASGTGGFESVVLPGVTLALPTAAVFFQVFSAAVFDAGTSPFVFTANAKGLSQSTVVFRHVLRNAMLPAITVIGLQVAYLAGGTAVVETVFSRDGIGRITVDAVLARDVNVVMGVVIVVAIVYAVVTLVVDALYGVIDPRTRQTLKAKAVVSR